MHKRDMMDFIGALKKAHHAQTALYFDESRIQGYTDQEIAQIAKQFNINITGQFYELMHQLGRCSGGLIWGYGISLYGSACDPTERQHPEKYYDYLMGKDDELSEKEIFAEAGVFDVKQRKIIEIAYGLCDEYYLMSADGDDRVWRYEHDTTLIKTDMTLFDFLIAQVGITSKSMSKKAYGDMTTQFDRLTKSLFLHFMDFGVS